MTLSKYARAPLLPTTSAGVRASDPRIQSGLKWLKDNQRESGRWWPRSLNTDNWHYITYSGTAFPLLALALCDELPRTGAESVRLTGSK